MDNILTDIEIEVILNDVHQMYGYDFSEYAKASLTRRINRLYMMDRFTTVTDLLYRLRTDENYIIRFVEEITVNVTEMFRDISFFSCLRKEVIPILSTYPHIRIWVAGCSSGEEAFSLTILLKEAGLLHKSIIYATDINPDVIHSASKGIFPTAKMKLYSENYIASGGTHEFSSYYTANYDRTVFSQELKDKIVFATHNLVSDRSFNEFQLILCRNVMIYFEKELQDKVLTTFKDSLEQLGFLALGSKETLRFSPIVSSYKIFSYKDRIWRKNI